MHLPPMILGLAALASTLGAAAQAGEVEARLDAEREKILITRFHTWVEDIAGFNRRHAGCDAASAQRIADYDTTHGPAFARTLGWRYDAAASRWRPAPPAQAEITLTYSGPVRSGTVTIDGKARSFCRAEAPDKLEVVAKYPSEPSGVTHDRHSTAPLRALAPGVDAAVGATAPEGTAPETPRVEIEARIERAKAALETQRASLDAFAAEERRRSACSEQKADEQKRYDGSESTWERRPGLKVAVSGPAYSGPVRDKGRTIWLCGAMRPDKVIASALYEQEGETSLDFTVTKPTPEP